MKGDTARLHSRLQPGAVVTCVENTHRPERNGARQTVTGPVLRGRLICATPDQLPVVIDLPGWGYDVEWLDNNTARWPLGGHLSGHSVTYRFDGGEGHGDQAA